MKLKFIKPSYDKKKLYRLAIRESTALLVKRGVFKTYKAAHNHLMKKAKQNYH